MGLLTVRRSPRPRIRTTLIGAAALVLAGAGIATAVAGVPEIDGANATIRVVASSRFTATNCPGEDGLPYVTFRGAWKGNEIDVTPGSTDYNLSGPLSVTKIVWTVNLETRRGVFIGAAVLIDPATGLRTYGGTLRLVTQGMPSPGAVVAARGWLAAATWTAGAADGGSVLANVEMQIDGSFAANGTFGDSAGTFGTPSFAVTTANQAC